MAPLSNESNSRATTATEHQYHENSIDEPNDKSFRGERKKNMSASYTFGTMQ